MFDPVTVKKAVKENEIYFDVVNGHIMCCNCGGEKVIVGEVKEG